MKTAATEKNDTKAASPKAEAPLVIRNQADYKARVWRCAEDETTAEPDEDQLFGIRLFAENWIADLNTARSRRDAYSRWTKAKSELAELLHQIEEIEKVVVSVGNTTGEERQQAGIDLHQRRIEAMITINECASILRATCSPMAFEEMRQPSMRRPLVIARIEELKPLVDMPAMIDGWYASIKRLRAGGRNQSDGPSWKTDAELISDYQTKIRKAWKRKGEHANAIQESKDLQAELVKLDADVLAAEASIFDPRKMKWSFEGTDVEPREVKQSFELAFE